MDRIGLSYGDSSPGFRSKVRTYLDERIPGGNPKRHILNKSKEDLDKIIGTLKGMGDYTGVVDKVFSVLISGIDYVREHLDVSPSQYISILNEVNEKDDFAFEYRQGSNGSWVGVEAKIPELIGAFVKFAQSSGIGTFNKNVKEKNSAARNSKDSFTLYHRLLE